MRFLLDENTPRDAAVALRNEGHDVVWVPETPLREAKDEAIWAVAARSRRVLVTADLGFPLPVTGQKPLGLVILRGFDRISSAMLAAILLESVRTTTERLRGHIVVIAPGRVRLRKL